MALFRPGNCANPKGGRKGHKPGHGRPPDWLKKKCADIIDRKKLIEFLGDVASGEDVEQVINQNGECLKVPASVKDRMRAIEMLLERGFGKPAQPLTNDPENPLPGVVLLPPQTMGEAGRIIEKEND